MFCREMNKKSANRWTGGVGVGNEEKSGEKLTNARHVVSVCVCVCDDEREVAV